MPGFPKENTLPRSISEIVEKIRSSESLFGFETSVWASFLPAAEAAEFVTEEYLKKLNDGTAAPTELSTDAIKKEMAEYMSFAWGKAEDHRGLSAGRSIEKMEAWVWLLGDDLLLADVQAAPYPSYGAPKLKVICERLGFPIPESEGIQRMMNGLPCTDDCDEGCR